MEQQPALSVLTVETLPVHRLHCRKFAGNAIVGSEIYMYEASTRSRDVYTYVYIRKQWHNRDGYITIEKRHVIKCCPKVIDMEVNGKMWKIVVDVLQVSSFDSRNREKHIILNGTKCWSEYFLKRQIMEKNVKIEISNGWYLIILKRLIKIKLTYQYYWNIFSNYQNRVIRIFKKIQRIEDCIVY